jgi:hypothetical protein
MTSRLLIVLGCALVLLSASPSFAQIDNSCTYRYSWGTTADFSFFGFCLTKYGTLASLQTGPTNIGIDQLDPVNPIEGWILRDQSGFNFYPNFDVAPGLGQGVLPTVTQPKGAGNLPIIFTWDPWVKEIVTATPSQKSVVFTMDTIKAAGTGSDKGEFGFGPVVRFAQLRVNGSVSSSFDNSSFAAFGYKPDNGVILTGTEIYHPSVGLPLFTQLGNGCISQQVVYGECDPAFVGQGTIWNYGYFSSAGPGKNVFTYKIF